MNTDHQRWIPGALAYAGSGLLLLVSYFFLYTTMQMVTATCLAPLSSFFDTRPRVFLLTAIVIGASALLLLARMAREQDKIRLILTFALDNLLSFFLFTGLAILIHQLPRSWSPWPGFVSAGALLLALFWAQGSGWPWRQRPVIRSRLLAAALGLLLVALIGALGGITVAPSEQVSVPATRVPSSPPATGPAAQSTPGLVPTAIAPAQETRVSLGSRPLHGEPPFAATLSASIYLGVDGACQSLRWHFDDGNQSEQPCPSDPWPWRFTARHTYTASGTYHPRLTLALADERTITSDTQTVVVAEPQPARPLSRVIFWGAWALSLLAATGALVWLRGRPRRLRVIGYALVALLLIAFVPPFSYLPDPLGIVWAAVGGYAHDPRLPFADRFLVAGSPVAHLRPWLDGLIGQTGLDPLDPTAPLARYEPVRVRVPRHRAAPVEVLTRFTYADGSRRIYAIPLYQPSGPSGLYQADWAYDGLARLRTEHRELPDIPFPDASPAADTSAAETSAVRLGEPQRLPLPREAQRLDTANPSNWYWYRAGYTALWRHAAWSPTGDAFLVRAFADYDRDDLWLVSVDGSQAERLAEDVIDFGWSPGGRYVVYTRRTSAWTMGVFALSLEERWERQLAQLAATGRYDFPGVSEEGVWYASEGALWLAPFDGGAARRIDPAHWGAQGPVRPAPDGSLVAYACSAGICLQDRSGGARRTIDAKAQQMAWSPDGSRLAAVAWEGRDDVALTIARRDGQIEQRVIIAPDGVAGAPQWTPDGQRLFVQTAPFGGRRIITVGVATGAALDLSRPCWDAWFDLAPDGERLLLTNGRGGFWVADVPISSPFFR
ncbi:MAG: hypothetical protein ACP5HM_02780 [Anaerolineae bacterium]